MAPNPPQKAGKAGSQNKAATANKDATSNRTKFDKLRAEIVISKPNTGKKGSKAEHDVNMSERQLVCLNMFGVLPDRIRKVRASMSLPGHQSNSCDTSQQQTGRASKPIPHSFLAVH